MGHYCGIFLNVLKNLKHSLTILHEYLILMLWSLNTVSSYVGSPLHFFKKNTDSPILLPLYFWKFSLPILLLIPLPKWKKDSFPHSWFKLLLLRCNVVTQLWEIIHTEVTRCVQMFLLLIDKVQWKTSVCMFCFLNVISQEVFSHSLLNFLLVISKPPIRTVSKCSGFKWLRLEVQTICS